MCRSACDVTLPSPFPRIRYEEALNKYGSDKPDIRYALNLVDISHTSVKNSPLVKNILGFFTDRKEKFLSTRGACEMLAAHTPIESPYIVSLPAPKLRTGVSNKEIDDLILRAKKAAGVLVLLGFLSFIFLISYRNPFRFAT